MSQKDGQTKTIGDHEYTVYPLPPLRAHKLLLRLLKMMAPAIEKAVGKALDGAEPGEAEAFLDQEVGAGFLARAAGAIIDGVDEATTDDLIQALREATHVGGVPLKNTFDEHFRGAPLEMYQWIAFGVQAQWGKLFSASGDGVDLRGAFGALLGKGKDEDKGSTSPST